MKKYLLALFAGLVLSLAPTPAMAQSEDGGMVTVLIYPGCNPCVQSCQPVAVPASFIDIGFLMGYYDTWWWANMATVEDWAGYYVFFF